VADKRANMPSIIPLQGSTTRLASASGTGFQSSMQFQEDLVANRGEIVIHETGVSCPKCRASVDDDVFGSTYCTSCRGTGWLWRNPRKIQGLVTGISQNRDLRELGFLQPGDCVLSTSPRLVPQVSDFDKLTFTWPLPLDDGQVIVRKKSYQREIEKYGTPFLEQDEDRIFYEGVNTIHCEDEHGIEYYQEADFIFNGKRLKWIGNKPARNVRYVIKYEAFIEWIVSSPPLQRIDHGVNIGPRIILQKRHVALLSEDVREKTAAQDAEETAVFNKKVTV